MKLRLARVTALRLPLGAPLATAHGVVRARDGALLELESDGQSGFGEALPLPGFGLESASTAGEALVAACRRLVGSEIAGAHEALVAAKAELADAPCAGAALDTAWRDLEARLARTTLATQLAASQPGLPLEAVATGALLSGQTPEACARAAAGALSAGFQTLKLKLGSDAFARDLERIDAVRSTAPHAALRLDANGAWDETDAERYLDSLRAFAPELLEQPVAFDAIDALARLRANAGFPLAADEAVRDVPSAQRLLDAGAADVLILKPAAIGGPGAALAIAAAAARSEVAVLVTSFLDGAIGRSAALHVAASLPRSPHAAGLATGTLLADDIATVADAIAGELRVPTAVGIGVAPEAMALTRLSTGTPTEIRS